jgi:formate hydrogenlyase subunit 6/NADH:ubiquinone oxidoreductase subunit I
MKLPSLFQWRILKLALVSLFSRPYTSKFHKVKYEPIKQYRGRPRYDEKECIGCGACAEVCPSIAIDVTDVKDGRPPVRKLVHHLDTCIQCGLCEKYCTTEKGIKLTNEWDYAAFSLKDFEHGVEKELLLCEECGSVIAPLDQIRWLALRLGPLAFCNPTLMLVSHKELAVVDKGFDKGETYPDRARRISIQCPRCRRKTALTV